MVYASEVLFHLDHGRSPPSPPLFFPSPRSPSALLAPRPELPIDNLEKIPGLSLLPLVIKQHHVPYTTRQFDLPLKFPSGPLSHLSPIAWPSIRLKAIPFLSSIELRLLRYFAIYVFFLLSASIVFPPST